MATARYPRTRPVPAPVPAPDTPRQLDTPPPSPLSPPAPTVAPLCDSQMPGPRPRIPLTKDMHLLWEYNTKYLSYTDYDPSAASLGKLFYEHYLSLSAVGNDTRANDASSRMPPLPHNLLRKYFGRPSNNHGFHQTACFETAYIIILKSGFFDYSIATHSCRTSSAHAYTCGTTISSGLPNTT